MIDNHILPKTTGGEALEELRAYSFREAPTCIDATANERLATALAYCERRIAERPPTSTAHLFTSASAKAANAIKADLYHSQEPTTPVRLHLSTIALLREAYPDKKTRIAKMNEILKSAASAAIKSASIEPREARSTQ